MDPTGKGDQPDTPEDGKEFNDTYDNKGDQVSPPQPWKSGPPR
ncbi:MAG: hypothetical protein JWN03_6289 [Nocardia sp.]|nr:hypothetical protein [Nocardia sp.]MCU1646014.1 hypothetical protein [Nocardia sp.]